MMAVSEFGRAFRAARAAGKKDFSFGGKRYTTELAKPAAARPAAPATSAATPVTRGRGTPTSTPEIQAQERARREAAKAKDAAARRAEVEASRKAQRAARDSYAEERKRVVANSPAMRARNAPIAIAARNFGKPVGQREPVNYAKGGSVRTRGDGIVSKGHTKGKCV